MFRYFPNSKTIVKTALIIIAVLSIIIAMLIIGSGENMSEIERAAKAHRNVFIIYILLLSITVLLSAWLFISSNKLQDAIKADADSKIEIAKTEAVKANERIANLTVTAKELEKQNLTLRTDLNNAAGEVAILQTEAANAQRALLEIQERMKPRLITENQRLRLHEVLKNGPKGQIRIFCVSGNLEAHNFAIQIADVLTTADWVVDGVFDAVISPTSSGLEVAIRDEKAASKLRADTLRLALSGVGFPTVGHALSGLSDDKVQLTVHAKP